MNPEPRITELARCITADRIRGSATAGVVFRCVGKGGEDGPCAFLNPERETVRQQGRRMKDLEEPMFTLTTQDLHGIAEQDRIRKLMPIECWRLQGFTDEQFLKAKSAGISDARLYKMAGNGQRTGHYGSRGGDQTNSRKKKRRRKKIMPNHVTNELHFHHCTEDRF